MAPIDLLYKLKNYYVGQHKEENVPVIASQTAALLSIAYTVLYVAPFYVSSTTRPSPRLSRDAPSVIRARIRAVTFTCILSTLITFLVVVKYANASPAEALKLLGWWPISVTDIAKVFLLTATLFLGPLFEAGVVEGGLREWIRGRHLRETLSSWMGWRNFIAGPITEEVVFRSAFIPLHILAHIAPSWIVFVTPLYFGIAHIHHFYEYVLTHPDTSLLPALVRSVVQFAYTSVFGFYVTFVLLRTGSLPAIVIIHSFCNWSGLPRLWGRVGLDTAETAMGPSSSEAVPGKDVDKTHVRRHSGRVPASTPQGGHGSVILTILYYFLLFAGAFGFWKGLWPLTESSQALVDFAPRANTGA